MKRKDIAKLHNATKKELDSKLKKLQKQLVQERMNISLGNQKNTSISRNIKKDIARIKTILHLKEITPSKQEKKKGSKTK